MAAQQAVSSLGTLIKQCLAAFDEASPEYKVGLVHAADPEHRAGQQLLTGRADACAALCFVRAAFAPAPTTRTPLLPQAVSATTRKRMAVRAIQVRGATGSRRFCPCARTCCPQRPGCLFGKVKRPRVPATQHHGNRGSKWARVLCRSVLSLPAAVCATGLRHGRPLAVSISSAAPVVQRMQARAGRVAVAV